MTPCQKKNNWNNAKTQLFALTKFTQTNKGLMFQKATSHSFNSGNSLSIKLFGATTPQMPQK